MDILDMLDAKGDEKPFESSTSDKKINYWEDTEIKGVEIDPEELKPKDNSFVIVTYTKDNTLPADVEEEIFELAKALAAKGYTFRHTGGADDSLQNKILEIEGIRVESYLPWSKFNPNIKNPKMKKPSNDAYHIAAAYHKAFKKLPNSVRTILARNVNVTLGEDCKHPTGFIIGYTEDGAEGLGRKLDYKITGNLAFFLKLAEESNIPVFNVKKDDAVKRLVEYIKNSNKEM